MSIDPAGQASPVEVSVALAVLGLAVFALFGRRRLVCVVGFLVLGAMLSLYWGLIGAPDVALAEAAVGTGVTGALFVAAVTALGPDRRVGPAGPAAVGASLLAAGALALVLGGTLSRAMLPEDPALAESVAAALPQTGVQHPVTGVLLNLRSFDTLMEMVVLLVAVAIALAFLSRDGQPPSARVGGSASGDSPVLDRFARVVSPVLILLAGWLLVAGSSRPGGAFQSGAVIAATLVVLHLTGLEMPRIGTRLRLVLAAGVAAFILVGVGGLVGSGSWLQLRGGAAAPVTIALETVLAIAIGASLALLFRAIQQGPRRRPTDRSHQPRPSSGPGGRPDLEGG